MSNWDPERLISASEVERWSYCPLSWYLERKDSMEESPGLEKGIKAHATIGKKVQGLKQRESGLVDSRSITIAYLAFASVLVTMSLLLLLLNNIGFLQGAIWQLIVIIIAIGLLLISLSMYLFRTIAPSSGVRKRLKELFRSMERSSRVGGYFPYLSYVFGLLLLFNGIVLLRPLGIPDDAIVTVFTISLIFLYLVLLGSLMIFFIRARKRGSMGDIKIGLPMLMVLLVGLSVLFIMFSERFDPDDQFGWIFLIFALIWFIGALLFDAYKGFRTSGRKTRKLGRDDLRMTSIALMASVFIVMSFLARGENLQSYNTISIAMAALWLAGAIFFFIKGSTDSKTAKKEREELDLPGRSRVVSVDDIGGKKRGKPLVSKKHYLVGSPDILIEESGKIIPVEIKTGRIPDKPHFSHTMQLGAYLVLVDVNYDQRTPHGYVEYSPGKDSRKRHRIEWDMLTKALVLSKVSEIREAERQGSAHRDHNREGKCRHCSRRSGCPERLV